LAQLRQQYQDFVAQNAVIIVVGPDNAKDFQRVWNKEAYPFIGLPDPQHTVLDLFGQEVNLFKLGRMPAQVIIDQQGLARFVHYGHNMQDIPSNQELLDLLAQFNQAAPL